MSPPTGKPTNGVLPVPAAVLQKQSTPAPRGPTPKKPTPPRLKVVLRRLPPGLTEAEFEQALGEDWKVGSGKVDWFEFKEGKISTDAAKPSRPARAYLHLTEQAHLQILSENVQQATFTDAKNTSKDPALIGPPVLEFAPYNRIPVNKKRTDRHQGTIDQEPDFIEFLQSLTNPIQRPSTVDIEQAAVKEKVKTTPLIEHIREKKAAKDKPSKSGKHGRGESKESKGSEKEKKGGSKAPKEILSPPEKGKRLTKAEKAAKEAVKVLNREASANSDKSAPSHGTAAAERRRERAPNPISVAAKIQRDLGLAPAAGRRAKREQSQSSDASSAPGGVDGSASTSTPPKKDQRAPKPRRTSKPSPADKAAAESSTDAAKLVPTGPAHPTLLKKPPGQAQPPKGPAAARVPPLAPKGSVVAAGPASDAASSGPNTPTTPAAAGRQAFLKHANPSQGITEPLIEEAFKVFGVIEKVEIDRKKGFAYVDFADVEGLQKAIAGSPVKIAQGAVQVLKRHEKPAGRAPAAPAPVQRGGFRGGRGGRGRGGGRGGIGGPAATAATAATTPATPAAPTAPTAPAPPSGPAT